MNGFSFNGTHSSTYNIVAKSVNRPLLPPLRKREVTVFGKHGTYSFGDNTYDKRLITVAIKYVGSSLDDLRDTARDIAAWLACGEAHLIFDDEADLYYESKLYSEIGLANMRLIGEANLTFECQPFANAVTQTTASYTITADVTASLTTSGTFAVRPDINISGSFTTLSITIDSATLTYAEAVTATQTVTIDNENYTVKLGSTNKMSVVSGDVTAFLEIPVGGATVTMEGTGLNCNVHFTYNDKFL